MAGNGCVGTQRSTGLAVSRQSNTGCRPSGRDRSHTGGWIGFGHVSFWGIIAGKLPGLPAHVAGHGTDLIDDHGSFVVGYVSPIPCAAIASDQHNMLAALVRRRGEALTELLGRLEAAVAKAYDEQIYTDEING